MNHLNCIFCKIISDQIPSKKIKETQDLIVIKDIAPQTPIHFLIIPKKHVKDLQSCKAEDQGLLGSILLMATELSTLIDENGSKEFRIVSNNGSSVGQSVFHLHFHFLAGKKLSN